MTFTDCHHRHCGSDVRPGTTDEPVICHDVCSGNSDTCTMTGKPTAQRAPSSWEGWGRTRGVLASLWERTRFPRHRHAKIALGIFLTRFPES